MKITKELLDNILEEAFDVEGFLSVDPCGIVYELLAHTADQLDIELGALFVAMISWGNRKAIRSAARKMLGEEMRWHPGRFIINEEYEESYASAKNNCVYRTLNVDCFKAVCRNLRAMLKAAPVPEGYATPTLESLLAGKTTEEAIATLCQSLAPAKLGVPGKSACKRICMFMRWMTRTEAPDLGIWKNRKPGDLYAVMDVHVCTLTSSILKNRQASWKSCLELTEIFRSWDDADPLKYDIALMTLADRISAGQMSE